MTDLTTTDTTEASEERAMTTVPTRQCTSSVHDLCQFQDGGAYPENRCPTHGPIRRGDERVKPSVPCHASEHELCSYVDGDPWPYERCPIHGPRYHRTNEADSDPPTYTHRREVAALRAEAASAQDMLHRERGEFEQWKEQATQIAHRYADDNNLCSVFDDCMEDIGLPRRDREFSVEVEVKSTIHLTVTARNEEDARSKVSYSEIESHISDVGYPDVGDYEILSAEED